MTEIETAFLVWLPAGTILPFLISKLTGSDWRGALIEASLFAALGLLIYPTALALATARFVDHTNVTPLFLGGYLLATLTLLLIRRRAAPKNRYRRR